MSEEKDLKLGAMPESKLRNLKYQIDLELQKRDVNENTKDYIDVIYCDDGSEGFYCPVNKWNKLPAKALKSALFQTIKDGGTCTFSIEKFEKEESNDELKRYEWIFNK